MDINTVTKAKGQLIINSKICQFLAINRKQREGLEMTKSQLYDIIKCLSSIIIKSFEQQKPQSANCPSALARFSSDVRGRSLPLRFSSSPVWYSQCETLTSLWRHKSDTLLYIKSQETKSGKGNQNNFTRVFPRSDFGKTKISYNFFAEESRPLLS